jgi:hypothetical protein
MGLKLIEELFKLQPTTPEEGHEGLRILARLIAREVIKDTQAKQSPLDIKQSK